MDIFPFLGLTFPIQALLTYHIFLWFVYGCTIFQWSRKKISSLVNLTLTTNITHCDITESRTMTSSLLYSCILLPSATWRRISSSHVENNGWWLWNKGKKTIKYLAMTIVSGNRSESDLRSCEATYVVAKKGQKKTLRLQREAFPVEASVLGFLCNFISYFTTAQITFTSILYPQFIWFISCAHHLNVW